MSAPVKHPQLGDIGLVNQPVRLSRTPHEIRSLTPDCGQHTDDILRELGYQDGQIADLRKRCVV
jgi:crotonobetainyl-CoA:carnitine CoA-transferase CaiB-like acyl-CoA transferase